MVVVDYYTTATQSLLRGRRRSLLPPGWLTQESASYFFVVVGVASFLPAAYALAVYLYDLYDSSDTLAETRVSRWEGGGYADDHREIQRIIPNPNTIHHGISVESS